MNDKTMKLTTEINKLADLCKKNNHIDPILYQKFDVKQGLRDINGKGVLAGLTTISKVQAQTTNAAGKIISTDGLLEYRGITIHDVTQGYLTDKRFGFEEVSYLLLFGNLPNEAELLDFQKLLASKRKLPTNFVRDVLLTASSKDIMNVLARSVLTLASYDESADDISIPNVLDQSLMLISVFPMLAVYAYHAYCHYECEGSLYIHYPSDKLSNAENLLRMLRPDQQYTQSEATILDLALVLHMEHGGGNNSSFTTHVVTSSGTDTYSTIAAALGSLKGPKHGGANIKVVEMFEDLKQQVTNIKDEEEVRRYLKKLLNKEAFDQKGLIYGMGHAVYSISDPRAEIFKGFVKQLATEKDRLDEFQLYTMVENLAPKVIGEERHIYKGVSANVDFFSGFVYSMLDLPTELFTPIFAMARIVGWSAHRLEELINTNKIIRPAYDSISEESTYTTLEQR
ncbi:citrate/2-methylcitrate synthase [Carnobacterium gallinarum]|uniref:citrate/2-methylcitrate synthase n=1 Tax=Carnobacterium gallinarum TaxID=2749 RepID=UPI0005568B36|nr:citrate/2-methylcitrate synthase [Carnobacterium gallinarum]